MVMKLYGPAISGNVIPVMGLCVENGIPYDLVPTDILKNEHKTAEFLKMNPMHCVPTLSDDGYSM
jgi:glutathione S-transferase